MIAAVIILGYLAIVGNKYWARRHVEDRKATAIILAAILIIYAGIYSYLTFFYREQMTETHIRLEPFWSYREAFEGWTIARLGLARSIALNIAITIPLGYLLPGVFRFSKHRYLWMLLAVLCLSVCTELIQLLARTGLAETDDMINNMIGAVIGMSGYWAANICLKGHTNSSTKSNKCHDYPEQN